MNTLKPHPYAEILRAIADGHQIQFRRMDGKLEEVPANNVLKIIGECRAARPNDFSIKPRTITINGHEVPEPLRVMPPDGTEVFWPSFVSDDLVAYHVALLRDQTICNLLRIGMLHSNHEAAAAHAQALLSFTAKEAA